MENKKISLSFGIVVIVILVAFYIVLKDVNNKRVNDYKDYVASITSTVKQKNAKIRLLYNQLIVEQKMIDDLKGTLSETRNDLDALSKRLAQPAPVVLPVAVPVAAPAQQVAAPAAAK